MIFTDQDSGIMKALAECEVTYKDLQHVVYKDQTVFDADISSICGYPVFSSLLHSPKKIKLTSTEFVNGALCYGCAVVQRHLPHIN